MIKKQISEGLVHDLPSDLKQALIDSPSALKTWESVSIIARNEWICWTVTVKQEKTRTHHISRAIEDLTKGKRRPCCWVGCIHRTDKPVGAWAQRVLIDKLPKAKY